MSLLTSRCGSCGVNGLDTVTMLVVPLGGELEAAAATSGLEARGEVTGDEVGRGEWRGRGGGGEEAVLAAGAGQRGHVGAVEYAHHSVAFR